MCMISISRHRKKHVVLAIIADRDRISISKHCKNTQIYACTFTFAHMNEAYHTNMNESCHEFECVIFENERVMFANTRGKHTHTLSLSLSLFLFFFLSLSLSHTSRSLPAGLYIFVTHSCLNILVPHSYFIRDSFVTHSELICDSFMTHLSLIHDSFVTVSIHDPFLTFYICDSFVILRMHQTPTSILFLASVTYSCLARYTCQTTSPTRQFAHKASQLHLRLSIFVTHPL